MKKNLAIALTTSALTLGGAAVVGIAQNGASAETTGTTTTSQSTTSSKADPMTGLIDALVKKFNLKKSDVQAVFDEQHNKMDAAREADNKTQLAQLVKDGKLTQKQSDAITAKRAEIKKEMDANRSKGTRPSETEMNTKRTEMDKWFAENEISTEYRYLLMGGGHHGHGGRHGGPNDRKGHETNTSSLSNDGAVTTKTESNTPTN